MSRGPCAQQRWVGEKRKAPWLPSLPSLSPRGAANHWPLPRSPFSEPLASVLIESTLTRVSTATTEAQNATSPLGAELLLPAGQHLRTGPSVHRSCRLQGMGRRELRSTCLRPSGHCQQAPAMGSLCSAASPGPRGRGCFEPLRPQTATPGWPWPCLSLLRTAEAPRSQISQ